MIHHINLNFYASINQDSSVYMFHFIFLYTYKIYRRKLRSKSRPTGFVHHQTSPSQIGIRTVDVDNTCNFSTTSNLCISIVTWNMNGQVPESLNYSLYFFLVVAFVEIFISIQFLFQSLIQHYYLIWRELIIRFRLKIQQKWLVATEITIFQLLACKKLRETKLQLCFRQL